MGYETASGFESPNDSGGGAGGGGSAPWSAASASAAADVRDEEFDSLVNWTKLGTSSATAIDRAADFAWDGASYTNGTWRYELRNSRCWLQAARADNGSGMRALTKAVTLGTNDLVYMRAGVDWNTSADGDGTLGLELANTSGADVVSISISGISGSWLLKAYQYISNAYTAAAEITLTGWTCAVTILGIRKSGANYTFFAGDDHGNLRILGTLTPSITVAKVSVFIGNKTAPCLPGWVDYVRFGSGASIPVLP